jgi:amino acid transporter
MSRLTVLWAVGVGSVIGGDFFGWSYLLSSGIGSSLISLVLTMFMYYYMSRAVASLASIVTKPGGADVFVAEGMGLNWGFVTAALETAKILLCTCAINNGAVSYFQATVNLGGDSGVGVYLSYIALFAVFCYLNLLGAKYSGNFQICVTVFSLAVLVFYWSSVCDTIDFSRYATGSSSGWFVDGISGFLSSQPFASWLFLGFEELPLVAKSIADCEDLEVPTMVQLAELNEEAGAASPGGIGNAASVIIDSSIMDSSFVLPNSDAEAVVSSFVGSTLSNRSFSAHSSKGVTTTTRAHSISSKQQKTVTMAMLLSFLTIAAAGTLTTLLGASSAPGAYVLSTAASPLVDGVKGVYGDGSWVVKMLNVLVIVALVTPFNAFLLFSAHHLSLLSLNGMLPPWFYKDDCLSIATQQCRSRFSLTGNATVCRYVRLLHNNNSSSASTNSSNHGSLNTEVRNPVVNDGDAEKSPHNNDSLPEQPKIHGNKPHIPHPETPKNAIVFVGICGSLVLAILTLILGSG